MLNKPKLAQPEEYPLLSSYLVKLFQVIFLLFTSSMFVLIGLTKKRRIPCKNCDI